jgi:hypothetical protein
MARLEKGWERKHAVDQTVKWMDEQIAQFESAARDLREYKVRFMQAADEERHGEETSSAKLTDHLSWFVNSTKSLGMNLRLDLAVDRAVALAQTEPERKS